MYKRVRAHIVLLLCVLLLEGFVVALLYTGRTIETRGFWRYALQEIKGSSALRAYCRRTTRLLHCCTLLFGKDACSSRRCGSRRARPSPSHRASTRARSRHQDAPSRRTTSVVPLYWLSSRWRGAGRGDPRRRSTDGGSVLFSLYAQHAREAAREGRLPPRWRPAEHEGEGRAALFVPASEAVVERYDDICVICHDNFAVDGARRLTRTTPIKLPRCAHLLHGVPRGAASRTRTDAATFGVSHLYRTDAAGTEPKR